MQSSVGPFNAYPVSGDVLDGKYRVERLLGEGGMGAVAKATHLLRRAPVALKFMSPAMLAFPEAVERFVNEGVAASQIDSDHVVKVFDVGRLPSGAPYLVMEYLDGHDLGQLLAVEGPCIAPVRAVHFALQSLRALQAAHNAGIIHRDMKPSNCFVMNKDGERDFLKLLDFGVSKLRSAEDAQNPAPNLTRTNSALGTPLYMSPEQARSPRDVDARTDIYSVGAILYEMLSGRTPYTCATGEYTELLFKIFTTEPEPLGALTASLPEGLAAVVDRALLRERSLRFESAADMAEALAPFSDARSAALLDKLRGTRGRNPQLSQAPPMTPTPPEGYARIDHTVQARSFPPDSAEAMRAPRVPTNVGVTPEAAAARAASRRLFVAGAVLGAAALVAAAIAAFGATRSASAPVAAPHEPPKTLAVSRPVVASPPVAPAPAPPSVFLSPIQVPGPGPSSTADLGPPRPNTERRVAPAAPSSAAAPAAPSPNLPKQLSDLKIQ
ncbi:MAG: serine/threonine-protein kinase [Polyangiaceae bacterium]|jgi:serine/threonine-protein kinase